MSGNRHDHRPCGMLELAMAASHRFKPPTIGFQEPNQVANLHLSLKDTLATTRSARPSDRGFGSRRRPVSATVTCNPLNGRQATYDDLCGCTGQPITPRRSTGSRITTAFLTKSRDVSVLPARRYVVIAAIMSVSGGTSRARAIRSTRRPTYFGFEISDCPNFASP